MRRCRRCWCRIRTESRSTSSSDTTRSRGYETHDGYLGACVGRVANRLGGAQFTLNGKTYILAKNDGKNHLHGGLRGFDKYVWDAEVLEDGVKFSRVSPDGEEGYPARCA